MVPKRRQSEIEERHEGTAARAWLYDHRLFINKKWKRIELRWNPKGVQDMQEESGETKRYIRPAFYILSFRRNWFRFFGMAEKTDIWFQEDDISSVIFLKSTTFAFWDADYEIRIIMPHSTIYLYYRPPFFGATPVANARHSEEVLVSFNMDYKPAPPRPET